MVAACWRYICFFSCRVCISHGCWGEFNNHIMCMHYISGYIVAFTLIHKYPRSMFAYIYIHLDIYTSIHILYTYIYIYTYIEYIYIIYIYRDIIKQVLPTSGPICPNQDLARCWARAKSDVSMLACLMQCRLDQGGLPRIVINGVMKKSLQMAENK